MGVPTAISSTSRWRVRDTTDQRVQLLSFLIAEFHHVLLYRDLFPGHEATPSLQLHRFKDSPQSQGRSVIAYVTTRGSRNKKIVIYHQKELFINELLR